MKRSLFIFVVVVFAFPLTAEVRVGVNTEFYNTFTSLTGVDEVWAYAMTGQTGLKFQNKGSRAIRGELSLEFIEMGSALLPSLKKLYIRPGFGDVLVSVGKTRSTWGAGFAFNAGDIIFGSDSVTFDITAADPRTETAWLTSAEVPLGDFSFFELIILPGQMDLTDPDNPTVPTVDKTSAGGRVSFEAGDFNVQGGYLYRGDLIAGLGSSGHRAFISFEGISPMDWHLSTSTATDTDSLNQDTLENSWKISGGASRDHFMGEYDDISLGWRIEFLVKPFCEWEESDTTGVEYGLYLFPSVNLVPQGNLVYSLSSIISPLDLSAHTTFGVSWNIYEELTLLGYASVQTGEAGDVFNLDNPVGLSFSLGGRYVY